LSSPRSIAVAIDLGEDNDLHPLNKKDVGRRLAMLAVKQLYGIMSQCEGPQIVHADTEDTGGAQGCRVILSCGNAQGGLYAEGRDKGSVIRDFELQDERGSWRRAEAEVSGDKIVLTSKELSGKPAAVRYCYANTNRGALLYNQEGFPMSPLCMEL